MLSRPERWLLGVLWAAAAVAVAFALWMLLSAREDPPRVHRDPWPVVVRTMDGALTTIQPEDLDR